MGAFSDKPLRGEATVFTIYSDGRILGTVGESRLEGNWYWSDGYFCRTATVDSEDLGLDCEIIEQRGREMRYTRDMGRGETSIVALQ